MKKNVMFISLLSFLIGMSACQRDIDNIVPGPSGENVWFNSIPDTASVWNLKTTLQPSYDTGSFTISLGATSIFTNIAGLQVYVQGGNIQNGAGQFYTGQVNVLSKLVKKRGDFIKWGMSTKQNDQLLVSAGAFFTDMRSDSGQLYIAPNRNILCSFADTPFTQNMNVFHGSSPAFSWQVPMDSTLNYVVPANTEYRVFTNHMNWNMSAYKFANTAAGVTALSLNLPDHFTNGNSIAYITFNDIKSVVAMEGNAVSRKFRAGNIPATQQVTVTVISKIGPVYYMGSSQVVTTATTVPGTYQEVSLSPAPSTFTEIINYLGTL